MVRVRPWMRADGFAPGPAEDLVVGVPAPHAVGEADQVLVEPRAAAREEGLEIDPVRPVRLVREDVPLDCRRKLSRGGAVVRLDDVVDDERAEEREARLRSPSHGEVVVAPEVRPGPPAEQQQGDADAGRDAAEPHAPGAGEDERKERDDQEGLVDGPRECDQRRRPRRGSKPPGRRGERRPDDDRGPDARTRPRRRSRSRARGRSMRTRDRGSAPRRRAPRGRDRTAARCSRGGAPSRRRGAPRTPRRRAGSRGRGSRRRRAARPACARASPTGTPRPCARSRRRRRGTTRDRGPAPSASPGSERRRRQGRPRRRCRRRAACRRVPSRRPTPGAPRPSRASRPRRAARGAGRATAEDRRPFPPRRRRRRARVPAARRSSRPSARPRRRRSPLPRQGERRSEASVGA